MDRGTRFVDSLPNSTTLKPATVARLAAWNPPAGSMLASFLRDLNASCQPARFDEIVERLDVSGDIYPVLNPRYMSSGIDEVFREVRGLLGQRMGVGPDLSAEDLAAFVRVDLDGVLDEVDARLALRIDSRRIPRRFGGLDEGV